MSRWGVFAALVGVSLLGVVLYQTDLGEVARHLRRLSFVDLTILVAIYLAGRLGGVLSWLYTTTVDVGPRWFVRLLRVHLIGSAVEQLTPFAGLGGEPIKLLILKREYGFGLREATASLALTRMTDLAAVIMFCVFGLLAAGAATSPDQNLWRPALSALGFLVASAAMAFALQRIRIVARIAPHLRERVGARLRPVLDAMVDVEAQMFEAYSQRPGRLTMSVAATVGEWMAEALLVWSCLYFLDFHASAAVAVSIAAFVLAVRTAFFFVPAHIGTQEAALVAICEALIGTMGVGLAIAAVIRLGELVWTAVGAAAGLPYLLGRHPAGLGSRVDS